jgi:hypothetical protein
MGCLHPYRPANARCEGCRGDDDDRWPLPSDGTAEPWPLSAEPTGADPESDRTAASRRTVDQP